MQLWIGTSGYSYPDWVDSFYPPRTGSANQLRFYAEHFPLVELNFTYYQVPGADQLSRMIHRVPADFRFIVKAHQSLTHELDLREADSFRAGLQPMIASGQLLNLLCQFPQRFHFNDANLRWLDTLHKQFQDLSLAMEFRHDSWDVPEIGDWLRERGITMVSVDVPDIPSLFPRKLVQTGREIYVRFHSRRSDLWYAGGHDRYDYHYSDAQMLEWVDDLAQRADETDRALLLFNNCRRGQAVVNAQRLSELLTQKSHPFQIVTSHSEQGTLF